MDKRNGHHGTNHRKSNFNPAVLWIAALLLFLLIGAMLYYMSSDTAGRVSHSTPVVTAPSEMNPATRNPDTGKLRNNANEPASHTASPPADLNSDGARTRNMVSPNAPYPGSDNQ